MCSGYIRSCSWWPISRYVSASDLISALISLGPEASCGICTKICIYALKYADMHYNMQACAKIRVQCMKHILVHNAYFSAQCILHRQCAVCMNSLALDISINCVSFSEVWTESTIEYFQSTNTRGRQQTRRSKLYRRIVSYWVVTRP